MAEQHPDNNHSTTNAILLIILVAVIAFGLYFLLKTKPPQEEPKDSVEFRFNIDANNPNY